MGVFRLSMKICIKELFQRRQGQRLRVQWKGNLPGIILPCMVLQEAGDHPATALFPVTVTFKELKLLANPLNCSGMSLPMALCTGS